MGNFSLKIYFSEILHTDVIAMTHQRKVLKMKVQTQYLMNINREIYFGASI